MKTSSHVSIPSEFFLKESRQEYPGNLSKRLLIEFVQNSLDAGATKMEFIQNDRELIVRDNGKGMNKEEILKGMLTFGGSIKENGSCGGFGKAKFLILFSQDNYEIKTQDLIATGACLGYDLTENNPYFSGTEIKIVFPSNWPNEMGGLEKELKDILSFSEIKCEIYFNGVKLEEKSVYSRALDKDLSVIKETEQIKGQVIVRFNGLYMFSQYSGCKIGYYWDSKGSSREVLNQNRSSFKDGTEHATEFNKFIRGLSTSVNSGVANEFSHKNKSSKIVEGIKCEGYNIPSKLSKRHKSIYSGMIIITETLGYALEWTQMYFYFDDEFGGMGGNGKISVNPNCLDGDNWLWELIRIVIHEMTHAKGDMYHDQDFIRSEELLFMTFMKEFSGINPLMAKIRLKEKEIFG